METQQASVEVSPEVGVMTQPVASTDAVIPAASPVVQETQEPAAYPEISVSSPAYTPAVPSPAIEEQSPYDIIYSQPAESAIEKIEGKGELPVFGSVDNGSDDKLYDESSNQMPITPYRPIKPYPVHVFDSQPTSSSFPPESSYAEIPESSKHSPYCSEHMSSFLKGLFNYPITDTMPTEISYSDDITTEYSSFLELVKEDPLLSAFYKSLEEYKDAICEGELEVAAGLGYKGKDGSLNVLYDLTGTTISPYIGDDTELPEDAIAAYMPFSPENTSNANDYFGLAGDEKITSGIIFYLRETESLNPYIEEADMYPLFESGTSELSPYSGLE